MVKIEEIQGNASEATQFQAQGAAISICPSPKRKMTHYVCYFCSCYTCGDYRVNLCKESVYIANELFIV